MSEYIMQEHRDMDGVDCYVKTGVLVRCKDCKWWREETDWCMEHDTCMRGLDFCSYGKKDGEQE